MKIWSWLNQTPKKLEPIPNDHGLDNNLAGNGATAWKHSQACPNCKNDVGHQERMTGICLSCGTEQPSILHWRNAATRRVVYGGKWVTQKRIRNINYIAKGGGVWEQAK